MPPADLPVFGCMSSERLEDTLACLQAPEDPDDAVRAAIVEIRGYMGAHGERDQGAFSER